MKRRAREVDVRKHLLRAIVLSGAVLGAWFVVEKPRLRGLVGDRLTLARAEADLVEANAFAAAASATTPVLSEAQRQIDGLHRWAATAGDQASAYGTFRSLASAHGVTIERLEPGSVRSGFKPVRDARSVELSAYSIDVAGVSDQVVQFVCDLDSKLGAGKVHSFRMAPVPGVAAGRVRATIEVVQVRLAPPSAGVKPPRGGTP